MKATINTQQRILNAARELIFARSYGDVGVAAICQHAGVKKGSFYHFFPSKQALILAVLDSQYIEFKENVVDNAFGDDVQPLARLSRLGNMTYQFQKSVNAEAGQVLGCPFGNLANELSTLDEPIRKKIQQTFINLQNLVSSVLDAAYKAGELADGVDIETTAQAMLAYFEGVLLLAKNRNNLELVRTLLPFMAQIRISKV